MMRALYQAGCVTVPKGLGGVLTIVLNGVLITRMTPAEFGVYSVCLTLVLLADAVLGSSIDMSAIGMASAHRAKDAQRARAAEHWALLFKLALATTVMCLLLPFASPASDALFHRQDPWLLMLVCAVAAGLLALRSVSMHLQLAQRFEAYAGLELLAQTLRVCGVGAVLLWWQPSATSLTLAALVASMLTLIGGVRIARLRWGPWHLRRGDGHELLRSLRWLLATFALSGLLARLDILLLTRWSTIEQVGLFAAAQVVALVPETLGIWLSVVFSPRVAPAREAGTLRRMMTRVQWGLGLLTLLVGLLAWAAFTWARPWLPAGYTGAVALLLPLMAGALAGMFALPVTVPYILFTRPRFVLLYDVFTLPALVLGYYFAITHSGALGAAWVSGGARMIKAAVLQTCALMWTRTGGAPLPRATA